MKEEIQDRSSTLRKLIYLGYKNFIRMKAANKYIKGTITISKAAEEADTTIWDMEKYLVDEGFKSSYSLDDLEEETKLIRSNR